MWKPTKKQHLTNKKYVDENGGSGSGSSVVFEGVSGAGKTTFNPGPLGLSPRELVGAIVVITVVITEELTPFVSAYAVTRVVPMAGGHYAIYYFSSASTEASLDYNPADGSLVRGVV